jgi:hypothetical protein
MVSQKTVLGGKHLASANSMKWYYWITFLGQCILIASLSGSYLNKVIACVLLFQFLFFWGAHTKVICNRSLTFSLVKISAELDKWSKPFILEEKAVRNTQKSLGYGTYQNLLAINNKDNLPWQWKAFLNLQSEVPGSTPLSIVFYALP